MPTISEPSDSDRRSLPATPAASGDVEAAWREPGTYRTADGHIEVIVDLAESTGYVRDMWPDEVAAIEAAIRAESAPPASETVDAAWEALAFALDDYADERLADQQLAIRREVAAQLLVEHRPRIEAAINALRERPDE